MQNKTMKIFVIIAAIAKPKIAGKHPRAPPELGTTELGTTELGSTGSQALLGLYCPKASGLLFKVS